MDMSIDNSHCEGNGPAEANRQIPGCWLIEQQHQEQQRQKAKHQRWPEHHWTTAVFLICYVTFPGEQSRQY